MTQLFDHDTVVVHERVGYFRAGNAFDLHTEDGDKIGEAIEEVPNPLVKLLKFTDYKQNLPFRVEIRNAAEEVQIVISRGWTFLRSRVDVHDGAGTHLGYFQQKLLSVGGKFELFLPDGTSAAMVKGNLIGWDFAFTDPGGAELGSVNKQWAGIGKEMFTTADTYVLRLHPAASGGPGTRALLLAAGICIDMVLKEQGR